MPRPWFLLNHLFRGHVLAYRLTRGVIGSRVPGGPPMLLLDHVGARSLKQRTTPLVYVRDGRSLVIVASKGGHHRHPAWFHNLKAHPDTDVQIGSKQIPVTAHVATSQERERLWPRVVATYGGYEGYQRRTTREIPLVVLEPR